MKNKVAKFSDYANPDIQVIPTFTASGKFLLPWRTIGRLVWQRLLGRMVSIQVKCTPSTNKSFLLIQKIDEDSE